MKTLKDIEYTKDDMVFCSEYGCSEQYENYKEYLKEEVFKWIKHLKTWEEEGKIDSETGFLCFDEDGSNENVQQFIKYFFNLTEDDFK